MRSLLLGHFAPWVRPLGKEAFLRSLGKTTCVLDVGCGNNSPIRAKQVAPDIHYTGLDIADHNQRQGSILAADEYFITTATEFAAKIEALAGRFDAVVSSHNLEHCEEPDRVLTAISAALRPGGRLYLSFPSEASTGFPRRPRNTLNFFDDRTHAKPPILAEVLNTLSNAGLTLDHIVPRHRPWLPMLTGLALEPVSWIAQRAMPLGTTWALYGFESVIWARRP